MSGENDIRDAYRHFHWSFALSRSIGSSRARAFTNAVEAGGSNAPSFGTSMDTWNNHAGIEVAQIDRLKDKGRMRLP
jgi:hypothetical protein